MSEEMVPQARWDGVAKERNAMREELIAVQDGFAAAVAERNSLREELRQAQCALLHESTKCEKWERGYVEVVGDNARLRVDVTTLTAGRDVLTAERDTLTVERDTLAKERDKLKADSDRAIQHLMAEMYEAQHERDVAVRERASAIGAVELLQTERDDLARIIADGPSIQAEVIAGLEHQVREYRDEVEVLREGIRVHRENSVDTTIPGCEDSSNAVAEWEKKHGKLVDG